MKTGVDGFIEIGIKLAATEALASMMPKHLQLQDWYKN